MKNSVLVGAVLALVGLMTMEVRAESDVYTNMQIGVGSDFNSGYGIGWAQGQNAITLNVSSSIGYNVEEDSGDVYVFTHFAAQGIWGDPTVNNSYYDMLVNNGLNAYRQFVISDYIWNGQAYEFFDVVNVSSNARAFLWRDDDQTTMVGLMSYNIEGCGAIPIESTAVVTLFEGSTPPSWRVEQMSRWLVTEGRGLVPSPGPAALLGLGSLFVLRRRR
jgi:MYXO-CTERM domain-containing protein